jgi:predicted AAA+ superfamily ATPase
MSMSRSAAGELIDERVEFVASQMRVSPTTARAYLTDDAISGLAQSMAFSLVEETPGADLFSAPRDAALPVRLAGRVSAGLAEVVRIRLAEREDLQHTREAVTQLAHAQGVLGLIMSDQIAQEIEGEPWIRAPRDAPPLGPLP